MRNLIWVLILAVSVLNITFANHAMAQEAAAATYDATGNAICISNGATPTCPESHPFLRRFGQYAACVNQLKGGVGVNPICASTSSRATTTTSRDR